MEITVLNDISATTELNNGVEMPWLGLGTWKSAPGQVEQAVKWAVEAGYRHIDTAAAYQNEEAIGKTLPQLGVGRKELFLVTKLWNEDQRKGPDAVLRAFEASLKRLGVDYLDLYLIHWPVKGAYKQSWKVMERLYEQKLVRAIGVSNFMVHHLEDLLADAKVVPAVNQVEFHPYLVQPRLLAYCVAHNIQHEAWSPLIRGKVGEIAELKQIAAAHGKTPEQVTLRWAMQKGSVVIPKSVNRERIVANAGIFDFVLSPEEMRQIGGLDRDERTGPDPNNFAF